MLRVISHMVWEELHAEKEVCVCVLGRQRTPPWYPKVEISAVWTHTFMIAICVTVGLQSTGPAAVRQEGSSHDASLFWLLGNGFFLTFGITFIYSDLFVIQVFFGISFLCLWKMVRFGRLTSWRSWDLLQLDSEIPESPPPDAKPTTTAGCQVRRLLTRR